jgi:hypothetical protein
VEYAAAEYPEEKLIHFVVDEWTVTASAIILAELEAIICN